MKNTFAVIMAGGIGSRFWPVSKTVYPKQFLDIFGTGKSLIQTTFDRFSSLIPKENIFIVTHESHLVLLKEQLPDLSDNQILSEPIMRNTAPCIAYACHKIKNIDPEATIVVSPSDHLILDEIKFHESITKALKLASETDRLITLGIRPSRPDTGYGYIQYIDGNEQEEFKKVKTFTEKPDLEIAKTFLQSGDFLWNSGIFIWSADSIIKSLKKYVFELNEIFAEGVNYLNSDQETQFIALAYQRCPNISIDFAIMEKADNVYVLPVTFGWSDLGTWGSVYDLAEKDFSGNLAIPSKNVMFYDSRNCMVSTDQQKLVVLQGVDNLIIAESDNVLLILPRDQEKNLKQILTDVKAKHGTRYL